MEQTLNIIDKENAFMFYNRIFTLKRFWDLMEENNVEMTYAKELALEIIGRGFSDQAFARIKNYGNLISKNGFVYGFSDTIYKGYTENFGIKNSSPDKDTKQAITKVLLENPNELTMLDYDTFLKNRFPENKFRKLKKNIDDLKLRLETEKENLCILAYFLAIYNTYVTGLILENAVGRFVSKIMQDIEKVYYTSAKIITEVFEEATALCDRAEFIAAVENYKDTVPTYMTAKEFNYFQTQRICWTAYHLNITDECGPNELLYILLNIDSSLKREGLKDLNVNEYMQLLEKELKITFPIYVI